MNQHWYEPLRALKSLGSQLDGPGSLAGLHEARQRHLGQFFTPDHVAAFMWRLVEPELRKVERYGTVSIIDTSVGSGRLLQFADPQKHIVGGMDVHAPTIGQVQEVFEAAGFKGCHFEACGMEAARPNGWTLAMINPPFSLHFETPLLKRYPCNSFGKFGAGTAAQSDYYAVAQALDAASIVVALLPRTVAQAIWQQPSLVDSRENRLKARFDLPSGCFRAEGAEVEVSVLVWGCGGTVDGRRVQGSLTTLEGVEPLQDLYGQRGDHARIRLKHLEDTEPTITLPVTDDRRVRVAHDGRKVRLSFACGFTQARVMNAVLDRRVYSSKARRLPKGYRYAGDGKLDLEAHLLQDDPIASVRSLLALIEQQDAEVVLAKDFWPYVHKRLRRHGRGRAALAHVVWQKKAVAGAVVAVARKTLILDPGSWLSPVIEAGERLSFERMADGRFKTDVKGMPYIVGFDELNASFEPVAGLGDEGWMTVHAGLGLLVPEQAAALQKRLAAAGIDKWLTWSFQQDDLVELLLEPRGAVAAWDMGLGKTRLAAALILLAGVKHGLVTTEAYLVPEFVEKLRELEAFIPASAWKVIERPEDLSDLRTINIISYERLRMPLRAAQGADEKADGDGGSQKGGRITYAHRLRRRIGLLVADEGELLSNPFSAQSRALWRVSAKRRYVLTGTPVPNYPRDVLPIISFVGGDATADQPWGYWGPHLSPELVDSVEFAARGIDAFIDKFVTLEWVTNEWAENMREGAKREIPKVTNLEEYRRMLAPHIKRRVTEEPAIAQHVRIPVPDYMTHEVDWDEDHLAHYITVADDFAHWFANAQDGKRSSLMMLLLRFAAVLGACNLPQHPTKGVRARYSGLTSKQRFVVDRLETLAEAGEKIICYAHSPKSVELLARELRKQAGVDSVVLHGGITAARRHKLLHSRFKHGSCPVLLATKGVTQAGLNIPQATRVLFYDREWTYKVEAQSLRRALRPETDHPVTAEFFHISGSADEYQAQMVAFKRDCFRAGIDWATPEMESTDFLHLDTILGRFVDELASLRGMKGHELREQLRLAA
jgi:hypothetical protein